MTDHDARREAVDRATEELNRPNVPRSAVFGELFDAGAASKRTRQEINYDWYKAEMLNYMNACAGAHKGIARLKRKEARLEATLRAKETSNDTLLAHAKRQADADLREIAGLQTVVAMVRDKCEEMLDSKFVVGTDDYSKGIRRGHRDAALSILAVLAKVRS